MAKTVTVAPGMLSAVIRTQAKEQTLAVKRKLRRAAQRSKELLQSATPVDQTTMIKAWKVVVLPDGNLSIRNDAPHAGIIERGAKPHKVGMAVIKLLEDWAERHGMEDPRAAAFGIAKKIAEQGSKAHWIVRDAIEPIVEIVHEELESVE